MTISLVSFAFESVVMNNLSKHESSYKILSKIPSFIE